MVNFFDKLYSSIVSKNAFLDKIRFYSVLRVIVRTTANIVLPIYFKLTAGNSDYMLIPTDKKEGRLIVSLTSFPTRINKLWMVIETILRQTKKPDMIILWLSEEQFPNLESLPKNLLKLQSRGLKIELRPNDLRSHKKYYYTLTEYPNDIMITIDDDVFYNTNLLKHLLDCHSNFTDCVCCNHSHIITKKGEVLLPYRDWLQNVMIENVPRNEIFPVGIGGVLYPQNFMCEKMMEPDIFMNVCKNADDVWLKTIGILQDIKAVQTNYHSVFLPIQNRKNKTLASSNISYGNDVQIDAVRKHCIDNLGRDPFKERI